MRRATALALFGKPTATDAAEPCADPRSSSCPGDAGAGALLGVAVGQASGEALDMAVGDAVSAWGFGPSGAAQESIRAAMSVRRVPTHKALEVCEGKVTKRAAVTLDLNASPRVLASTGWPKLWRGSVSPTPWWG